MTRSARSMYNTRKARQTSRVESRIQFQFKYECITNEIPTTNDSTELILYVEKMLSSPKNGAETPFEVYRAVVKEQNRNKAEFWHGSIIFKTLRVICADYFSSQPVQM